MSSNYRLVILPEAQNDIRSIILYIAGELAAPLAALELQGNFEDCILSLSYMPERIKTVDEQPWKNSGVRRTRVKNYYIYFVISESEETVKILAVIYTGRDQSKQMLERGMNSNK